MARGVNKVIILGNLGSDPDVRNTASGSVVTNISVATAEAWRDKQSGEMQERTEWHRVVFFGRVAEVARDYLRKGSQCYIEGRLTTEKWQAQDGTDRYTTKIVARELQLLGGRRDDSGPQSGGGGGYSGGQQQSRQQKLQDDFDDDIPFVLRLTDEPFA